MPFPVPLPPDVIVIHESPLLAVHAHPLVVETATEPVPPGASTSTLFGDTENWHCGTTTAACVTVNVCEAIVMVPVRDPPVFAATAKATEPLPLPVALDVIHDALLAAVQAQPLPADTFTVPAPPVAGTF